MEVLKKLAPKYWLGYYIVYTVTLVVLTGRYGRMIVEGTEAEPIFVAAAIFGVSTGVALTFAAASEGVGFLILLIPKRIREIKEEGRKEGREEGRAEAFAEVEARAKAQTEKREEERAKAQTGRRENGLNEDVEGLLKTAMKAGREMGVDEAGERLSDLFARYDRGEITLDELRAISSGRSNGGSGAN